MKISESLKVMLSLGLIKEEIQAEGERKREI